MTQITLHQLSKRYGYQWIIRDFNANFTAGRKYGITGRNGSGKSTLIRMISGFLTPTSGTITYVIDEIQLQQAQVFKQVSLVAPYTDLINEFTLSEMFAFHQKFKKFRRPVTYSEFEHIIELHGQKDKPLQYFSSGMKQKIQLSLALLTDTPVLLMDEPTSFLDKSAKNWFSDLLAQNSDGRVIIIASNDPFDIHLSEDVIQL